MAEVFTPTWIVNKQNNLVDEQWFGKKSAFNIESKLTWIPTDHVIFDNKDWKEYVKSICLEVSCGEGPYLTTRYDPITGASIPVRYRVGMLDRKLRVISENVITPMSWIEWAKAAICSVYAYDIQGDNVLLTRENLLLTLIEHHVNKFGEKPARKTILEIAHILAWTKETSPKLRSYVNTYLVDINNIPADSRCPLYRKWYCDSFTSAVKNGLRPKNSTPEKTVEDADNVIRHILSRLFEFLYISIYRETTFEEIFKNADPDTFLEAVGITKEDFAILNRYHIFEEHTLNSCIHDFFINESLGSTLDLGNKENRKRYRNSFDWYRFGVSKPESSI